jgi:hypothetical protein
MCGISISPFQGLGYQPSFYHPASRDVDISCPFRAISIITIRHIFHITRIHDVEISELHLMNSDLELTSIDIHVINLSKPLQTVGSKNSVYPSLLEKGDGLRSLEGRFLDPKRCPKTLAYT